MTRVMVFLVMLVFVFPSDGSSQTASLGDRIRVRQANGTTLTGTLATVSAEAIQLSVDSSRVGGGIAIPRSQIVTIERQQGTRNKSTPTKMTDPDTASRPTDSHHQCSSPSRSVSSTRRRVPLSKALDSRVRILLCLTRKVEKTTLGPRIWLSAPPEREELP